MKEKNELAFKLFQDNYTLDHTQSKEDGSEYIYMWNDNKPTRKEDIPFFDGDTLLLIKDKFEYECEIIIDNENTTITTYKIKS